MKISQEGIALIKRFESCKLTAYKVVPTEKYWTIGWGRCSAGVTPGMKITQKQADAFLVEDLERFERVVNKYDHIYHWRQEEFDALCSFAYNIGNVDGLTANGTRNREEIANAMLKYNKSAGKALDGLTKRRQAERSLFMRRSITDVAKAVISGKYGVGAERKRRLTLDGYDYTAVQAEVNRILKS